MGSHSHGESSHHIIPLKTYLGVFVALLVLTVITVAVTQINLGTLGNTIVAMIVASIKATFVLAYFMHLKYDDKLYLVGFLSAIFFLIVMYFFSILDILTRIPLTDVL